MCVCVCVWFVVCKHAQQNPPPSKTPRGATVQVKPAWAGSAAQETLLSEARFEILPQELVRVNFESEAQQGRYHMY